MYGGVDILCLNFVDTINLLSKYFFSMKVDEAIDRNYFKITLTYLHNCPIPNNDEYANCQTVNVYTIAIDCSIKSLPKSASLHIYE